ncbi:unnamed protein product [Lactuca saligna]|uniref:PB1-like domain-containing protein n=1 Tax=Lactuca saligna TaxID=75948 RepID=A0AA35YQI9_LACSI|nr:unnamed protein product [Lactuca saligna]
MYAGIPTWFSIKLHHGGKFTKIADKKNIGGEVCYIDYVDIDEFPVHELDAIMLDLGYPDPRMTGVVDVSDSPVIYYHFNIPNGDFQFGLRAYANDQDVINLSKYIPHNKLIEVYTKHGKTNLLTCFMSPNAKGKVVIEELTENDDQEAEVHVESSLRNMNRVNDEPIDDINELKEKIIDQDATTCVMDNIGDEMTGVQDPITIDQGCYKQDTLKLDNIEDDAKYEEDDAEYEDVVSNSEDVDVLEKVKHFEDEDKVDYIIDEEFRDHLWRCASEPTIPKFEHLMNDFS